MNEWMIEMKVITAVSGRILEASNEIIKKRAGGRVR